jgi:hypothetical protein
VGLCYRIDVRGTMIAIVVVLGCGGPAKPATAQIGRDDLQHALAAIPEEDPRRPDADFQVAEELDKLAREVTSAADRDAFRDQELAIYRRVVDSARWRDYARRDEVLFWYANALSARGRRGDADAELTQLVAQYPSSKLRVQALIMLGDERFDRADVAGARSIYQQAVIGASGELLWYVRYRTAWCDFNLGDQQHALEQLTEIARSSASEKLTSTARADLVRMLASLDPAPDLDEVRMRISLAADPEIAAKMLDAYKKLRASPSQ